MTVYIIFTIAGSDTGPFNLYSDADSFSSPFESGISKATLLSGYISSLVPLGTSIIRAISEGICTNFLDMPIITTTTSTTTSFTPPTTTTSTTTICRTLQIDVRGEDLNASVDNADHPDHTLFVKYNSCSGSHIVNTFDEADVSAPTTDCWNGTEVFLTYFVEDVETIATFSTIIDEGPCSP